jgi:phosphoribosylformylglycinamidine synthase
MLLLPFLILIIHIPYYLILYVLQVSAYCVGNLNMPENPLPWETVGQEYASNLATPAAIMVDASNGASDYGE